MGDRKARSKFRKRWMMSMLKPSGKKAGLILVGGAKLSLYRIRNKGNLLTSTVDLFFS